MPENLVDAEWVGPGGYEANINGERVALEPGAIVAIGHDEAHDSDNWRPVVHVAPPVIEREKGDK